MRNTTKLFGIIAFVVLFAFSTTVCFGQSGGKVLRSADELMTYLDTQPDNDKDNPIMVKMSIHEPMLKEIAEALILSDKYLSGKYVYLDLTSSPLTTIPNWAFFIAGDSHDEDKGCAVLTGIIIPDSVTSIGMGAFQDCINLTSVNIPNSVTSIEDYAFSRCFSLTNVTIPDSVISIKDSAFFRCSSIKSITIPDSVKSIGNWAFYSCDNLTSVTIGNSVASIGQFAFSKCDGLASVIIGNSVTTIGRGAFNDCHNLTSVTIPDSVTSIVEWAFEACYSLQSITIPNSVKSIGEEVFYSCFNLTSVTFKGTITPDMFSEEGAFPGDLRAKYLKGGVGTYTRANGKSEEWTRQ
jgi:hypothetical protein